MIARGSLPRCVDAALHAFFVQHYPMLSIVHNPTGNYYTVVTEEDIGKMTEHLAMPKHRLVFRGTHNELKSFCKQAPADLFGGVSTDAHPDSHEA